MKNSLVERFKNEKRWVNYKFLKMGEKLTKVPYQVNGRKASTIDENTWGTYDVVRNASERIGIVFKSDRLLLGCDIDHCIKDGVINHEKKDLIEQFLDKADTYCEISPSNTGLHLYFQLTEPMSLVANKKAPFELYDHGRYFTVTEKVFGKQKDVRIITPDFAFQLLLIIGYPWIKEEIRKNEILPKDLNNGLGLSDTVLLEKMFASKSGTKIKALYEGDISAYGNDDSSADLALCSHLAFWTCKNEEQMERMWLSSSLGNREKTQDRKDYRLRTILTAIKNTKDVYKVSSQTKDKKDKDKTSAADILLDILEGKENVTLFHDEQNDSYVALDVSGHREVWGCKSKAVRKWLAREFWNQQKNAPSMEAIKSALMVMEGRAFFDGPKYRLNNRFAWNNDELWYDLANDNWQAIKVNKEGWCLSSNPPIIFKRYLHSLAQVVPVTDGADINLLLKYINIKDEQQKILTLVYLVSCFVPDFPHVILVIFGSQGSSKSTFSKLLRKIIDPSMIEVVSMPENVKDLVQALAHHAFLFFDNVSYITDAVSDILCKAVTGSSFTKRELYTDDEDIIYTLKKNIGINGINLTSTRPDLLERSLIIELDRIEEKNRVPEQELLDGFEKDLPLILGGIFNTLVKAIQIKQDIKLSKTPRMADFALWGCAISEALGYSQEDFMSAYQININKQTETVLNESIVATAVISFMEGKGEWIGTATELLHLLNTKAFMDDVRMFKHHWPSTPNTLMRKLNILKVNLKQVGILFESNSNGNNRVITLRKLRDFTPAHSQLQVDFVLKDDTDGTDDSI